MSVEQRLAEELRTRAELVDPPDPDLVDLLGRGRRASARDLRRRRTTRLVGLAAAVAVVVAASLALGGAPDRPAPAEPAGAGTSVRDLPTGQPPELPHCLRGGVLRVGDRDLRSPCPELVPRGGSTVAVDERGVHVVSRRGLRLISRVGPSYWVPAVSADGRMVAWPTRRSDGLSSRVVVHALPSGRLLAAHRLASPAVWTPGFDGSGRVLVSGFGADVRRWVFDPRGDRLTAVTGQPAEAGAVAFVTRRGYAVRVVDGTGHVGPTSLEGEVDADGRFRVRRSVPVGFAAWSPDGTRLVHQRTGRLVVSDADDPAGGVVLGLPERGRPTVLPVWEDEDSLLVSFDPLVTGGAIEDDPDQGWGASPGHTWLLRCSAGSGECEVALRPRDTGRLWGPMYR